MTLLRTNRGKARASRPRSARRPGRDLARPVRFILADTISHLRGRHLFVLDSVGIVLAAWIAMTIRYDSFVELATAYGTSNRQGKGWGWHFPAGWSNYLSIVHGLGQTKARLTPAAVYTNNLVAAGNKKADKATAVKDAKAFKLNSTWQKVDPGNPNI